MYGTRRRAFYMDLTEHFFRLAVRRDINNVVGAMVQRWHKNTTKWLDEECTTEERALIRDFYTYNQTISNCTNYMVVNKIKELAERYAIAMELC